MAMSILVGRKLGRQTLAEEWLISCVVDSLTTHGHVELRNIGKEQRRLVTVSVPTRKDEYWATRGR